MDAWSDGNFWRDKTSDDKSIRVSSMESDWERLIKTGSSEDDELPKSMRDAIKELVGQQVKLGDDYFQLILLRLKNFLQEIRDELAIGDMKEDIAALCNFKYGAKVGFEEFSELNDSWNNTSNGLFGHDYGGSEYTSAKDNLNIHFKDEFAADYIKMAATSWNLNSRDYELILKPDYGTHAEILAYRDAHVNAMYDYCLDQAIADGDAINQVFSDPTLDNKVRYMNAIPTTINYVFQRMFVADDVCNLFLSSSSKFWWYTFPSTESFLNGVLETKIVSSEDWRYEPTLNVVQYDITGTDWLFKTLNRDLDGMSEITGAFALHCHDASEGDMWYVPSLGVFLKSSEGIVDMAYEQTKDRMFVVFNGDNLIYAFDGIVSKKSYKNIVTLHKELANARLNTFASISSLSGEYQTNRLLLDYTRGSNGNPSWSICTYYQKTEDSETKHYKETWENSPGMGYADYRQYNVLMFGDSSFNEGQLAFHNVSKNKEMYDILDVNEVDDCYYGLFRDVWKADGQEEYCVFKCPVDGVVQRLPWKVIDPHMYRSADPLYSLYVAAKDDDGKASMREVSVPDASEYVGRSIDLQGLYEAAGYAKKG